MPYKEQDQYPNFQKTGNNKFTMIVLLIAIPIVTICLIQDLIGSKPKNVSCQNSSRIKFNQENLATIEDQVLPGEINCFYFLAKAGQVLNLETSISLNLISPTGKSEKVQGISTKNLNQGKYLIRINGNTSEQPYKIVAKLINSRQELSENTNLPWSESIDATTSSTSELPANELATDKAEIPTYPVDEAEILTYNVKNEPQLYLDSRLQSIVTSSVAIANSKSLPINRLSITLINLNDASYAAYNEDKPFFPASVVKLFWLIALFGHYEAGQLFQGEISEKDIYQMMQDSDNNPASRILDKLTATESGTELSPKDFQKWSSNRELINIFFSAAGYQNVNINQKNFPIPDLSLESPIGRDLQIRGNAASPIRNSLTSWTIARLLFEIEQGQAISPNYSQKAKQLMRRDFALEETKQYDSIKGFFGGGLIPSEVELYSKPGWTSGSRQDAAIIYSADQQVRYILVILGDDSKYAEDWDIFPEISEYVFSQMRDINYIYQPQ